MYNSNGAPAAVASRRSRTEAASGRGCADILPLAWPPAARRHEPLMPTARSDYSTRARMPRPESGRPPAMPAVRRGHGRNGVPGGDVVQLVGRLARRHERGPQLVRGFLMRQPGLPALVLAAALLLGGCASGANPT